MSATAVPIRPVARGSVLKLWLVLALFVIAAAAMAWWTTKPFQIQTLPSGVRIRAIQEGTGPVMTTITYDVKLNGKSHRLTVSPAA